MTKSTHRIQVALSLPESASELVLTVAAILDAMTGNPFFPNPAPPLATIAAAVSELSEANVATESKARDTVAVRNEKQTALVSLLKRLKAYVQGVADDDPARGVEIIESAHMSVWKPGPGPKPPFDVQAGPTEGSVSLAVRAAAKEASYEWQWSKDGGQTWVTEPATLPAKTVVRRLPSGVLCLFRWRARLRKGVTEWSEPVSFRVP